jgi:hypothetical protein
LCCESLKAFVDFLIPLAILFDFLPFRSFPFSSFDVSLFGFRIVVGPSSLFLRFCGFFSFFGFFFIVTEVQNITERVIMPALDRSKGISLPGRAVFALVTGLSYFFLRFLLRSEAPKSILSAVGMSAFTPPAPVLFWLEVAIAVRCLRQIYWDVVLVVTTLPVKKLVCLFCFLL